MKLIYRQFDDNFDQLIRYYPRYYRDVAEMVAILHAHGTMADAIDAGMESVFDGLFVETADEATIAQWEEILQIPQSSITGKDLETRRLLVMALLIGFGHISASVLEQIIKVYTGADVDIELRDYVDTSLPSGVHLDGKWYLDGTQYLDGEDSGIGGRDQALYITIISEGSSDAWISDIIMILDRVLPAHLWYFLLDTLETYLDESVLEKVFFTELQLDMPPVRFFDFLVYLDGSELLDGSDTLDSGMYRMGVDVGTIVPIGPMEESVNGTVTYTYDLHFLDGSLNLDGSVILDSVNTEEGL